MLIVKNQSTGIQEIYLKINLIFIFPPLPARSYVTFIVNSSFCFLCFFLRIIALQCCVDFCHTTTQISHKCTSAPLSWSSLPSTALGGPKVASINWCQNQIRSISSAPSSSNFSTALICEPLHLSESVGCLLKMDFYATPLEFLIQ